MPLSQTPLYNLKVVLKETGIAADTLRAWERRYGIPRPQRTPGGHRLYSQHDIHLVKWLISRQAEGLSISRAVEQWNELTASGADPLAQASLASEPRSAPAGSSSLESLRAAWLGACLAYDETGAEEALNQALALYSVEIAVTQLIEAGLRAAGDLWHRGQASVQQEHFASALATRRIDNLISAAPAPARKETILLACPPEELHAFPLLLLSLLLRRRGFNTIYLGANVPLAQLEETIDSVKPALVLLSAQALVTAANLRDIAAFAAAKGVPVGYGGRIFNHLPGLRDRIAGEYLGETIEEAPQQIEQLLDGRIKPRAVTGEGPSALAQDYRSNLPIIEATLLREFRATGLTKAEFDLATHHLGRAFGAALDLGDIAYLELDLDWIRSLLREQGLPVEGLRSYLAAYALAVRKIMGRAAAEIIGWIDGYLFRIDPSQG
jgi:DNA-binding transcriptional MerR regulator